MQPTSNSARDSKDDHHERRPAKQSGRKYPQLMKDCAHHSALSARPRELWPIGEDFAKGSQARAAQEVRSKASKALEFHRRIFFPQAGRASVGSLALCLLR
jgi:hypothetical protein